MAKIKWLVVLFLVSPFFAFAAGIECPGITKSLYKGSRGDEVLRLQTYFSSDPSIYPEGFLTGYFGILTEKAVQRFQEKHGIVSSGSAFTTGFGSVGPRTRAKISELCSVPAVTSLPPAPTPPAPVDIQPAPQPTEPIAPAPAAPPVVETPSLNLKVNGSDGPVAVTSGSEIEISWSLSKHSWSWCNKLRSWSGSLPFPIVSGSEKIQNITSPKTYQLTCYLDSQSFDDLVNVTISPPAAAATATSSNAASAATSTTFKPSTTSSPCELTATKKILYINRDALEVTWETFYSTGLHFYWHDMIDGTDQGHAYGGKTNKKDTVSYLSKPATYSRYYAVYRDPNHAPEYGAFTKLPEPDCKSQAVTVEVKELQ